METLEIEVIAEDIGIPGQRDADGSCMIDRTIKRVFGEEHPNTGYSLFHLGSRYYSIDETARENIQRWDVGLPVEPFTFTAFPISV